MSKRRRTAIVLFEVVIWIVIIAGVLVMAGLKTMADAAEAAAGARTQASAAEAAANGDSSELPAAEPDGYWTGPTHGTVPATLRGGTVIRTEALRALLDKGDAVIVDASNLPKKPDKLAANSPWLPPPHAAIPKTLWIPGSGMGDIAPAADALYREQLAKATAGNLDVPIVVYCHERCWLSYNAARRAISYGYRQVHWYPDGIEGWRAAKLDTATVNAIER